MTDEKQLGQGMKNTGVQFFGWIPGGIYSVNLIFMTTFYKIVGIEYEGRCSK